MSIIKSLGLTLMALTLCAVPVQRGNAQSNTDFEGVLTTLVTIAGVDISVLSEGIDYTKNNRAEQVAELYKKIPPADLARMQATLQKEPLLGMALMILPPKGTLYVKGNATLAHAKGVGYELYNYHNSDSDQGILYMGSLVMPSEVITANYKPSQDLDSLFSKDKLITSDAFAIERTGKTETVAGYPCTISVYTPKSPAQVKNYKLRKLIVYTSKDMPKGINFSHPYYLPEDHGVLRIDAYMTDEDQPTAIYQITAVKKTAVSDDQLQPKKSQPVYSLTDMQYGLKALAIMMGGLSALGSKNEDDEP